MINDPSPAEQADNAARQADAQLAAACIEASRVPDPLDRQADDVPAIASAQLAATLAVAEQLRAFRLGLTSAIEKAARQVRR